MALIRDAGTKLNAVESASASVAVSVIMLTVWYRTGLRPGAGQKSLPAYSSLLDPPE
jgi:hypothetical protein